MNFGFDLPVLLTGVLIFCARVADVSLGTIRTISIVHGNVKRAFLLGFIEISLWLAVITTVLHKVMGSPLLGLFYALGFSTGNVVGIMLERKLAGGPVMLRILATRQPDELISRLESMGYDVLAFAGRCRGGQAIELNMCCQRRNIGTVVDLLYHHDPDALYIVEQVGRLNKIMRPTGQPPTGWRAIFKRK